MYSTLNPAVSDCGVTLVFSIFYKDTNEQNSYKNVNLKSSLPAQMTNRTRDVPYLTHFVIPLEPKVYKKCVILLWRNCTKFVKSHSPKRIVYRIGSEGNVAWVTHLMYFL